MSLALEKQIKFTKVWGGGMASSTTPHFLFVTVWSYFTYVTVVTTRYAMGKKKTKTGLRGKRAKMTNTPEL